MDSGHGQFIGITGDDTKDQEAAITRLKEEYHNHGGIFKIGDYIELQGSKFKVHKITSKKLILKLLKK